MPSYSLSEALEGLPDINRLTIVIVEGVNAILVVANLLAVSVLRVKEAANLAAKAPPLRNAAACGTSLAFGPSKRLHSQASSVRC